MTVIEKQSEHHLNNSRVDPIQWQCLKKAAGAHKILHIVITAIPGVLTAVAQPSECMRTVRQRCRESTLEEQGFSSLSLKSFLSASIARSSVVNHSVLTWPLLNNANTLIQQIFIVWVLAAMNRWRKLAFRIQVVTCKCMCLRFWWE